LGASVAAGVGYLLGKERVPNYTYLKERNVQFRVNARSGRTDKLGGSGWEPFSYDTSSKELPASVVSLSNGTWENGFGIASPGKICFDAQVNLSSVLESVRVSIAFDSKPADNGSANSASSSDPFDALFPGEYSTLKAERGNLLGAGKDGRLCGTAPRVFPTGAKWSYTLSAVRGWKE
jgi:hypothetical protein